MIKKAAIFILLSISIAMGNDESVFVRFKMLEPAGARYYVKLAGYIHIPNWYIPVAYIPGDASRDNSFWINSGQYTLWFDLKKHAGKSLHGRLNRSGGIAEFPNITVEFITDIQSEKRKIVIELATRPDEKAIVKRFEESFNGSLTSFLVSPELKKDAEFLETASQMTERRLKWAYEATGGKRYSPEKLIIQTSFWAPQRSELNLKEAKVLWLLGFNTVGNQMKEVQENFAFKKPGHMWANFSPEITKENTINQVKKIYEWLKGAIRIDKDSIFNFSDEITCPKIGQNQEGIKNFHRYLQEQKVKPEELGVKKIEDVMPIEDPVQLKEAQKKNPAASKIFYYTSKFRQFSTNQRLKWLTEAVHEFFGRDIKTSTLVADHPYFAGSGLGMGMTPNPAWGSYPLSCDWFSMAREQVVDIAGIEDWMGLQYMYGPNWTWEGFQLMGFQASIFRSGSKGKQPIIAWITPGNEINTRLKTVSALCQGAKHFFYWTYGPTATSTENYWSDLRGEYDAIASITRQLTVSEKFLVDGKLRPTKIALLYSISSDLWQPFGYIHMLERRLTYLALVHEHYTVDMLTEEDIISGRLKDYQVLYVTDPCIHEKAIEEIKKWVKNGGWIRGTCGAGIRNQFNQPISGLSEVFGIKANPEISKIQTGRWHIRGVLNEIPYLDTINFVSKNKNLTKTDLNFIRYSTSPLGAIGVKILPEVSTGKITATFVDGSPAVVINRYGRGMAEWIGSCPGIAYCKEAKFVADDLKEKWQPASRKWVLGNFAEKFKKTYTISEPVVEAGVYDSKYGSAIVLANFTYQFIKDLKIQINVERKPTAVFSCEKGKIPFDSVRQNSVYTVKFSLPLEISEIVLIEY